MSDKRIVNPLIIVLLFVILITFIVVNTRSNYYSYGNNSNSKKSVKNDFSSFPLKLDQQVQPPNESRTTIKLANSETEMDLYSNLNMVRIDLSNGKTDNAENRLRDLMVFYPEDRAVLTMLSGLLYMTNRYGEAQLLLKKLIELYPEDIYARENLAFIYEKNKEYDKAVTEFTAITSMSNESIASFVHLAGIYSMMNKKDKALFNFKIAYSKIGKNIINISLDPSFDNIRNTSDFMAIISEAKRLKDRPEQNVYHRSINVNKTGY